MLILIARLASSGKPWKRPWSKMDTTNKVFWERTGAAYSRKRESRAKQLLSALELGFIGKHLPNARRCLDIGCGNGRIIEFLSKSTSEDTAIMGVDIACSMV